jgi:hypothetical protein
VPSAFFLENVLAVCWEQADVSAWTGSEMQGLLVHLYMHGSFVHVPLMMKCSKRHLNIAIGTIIQTVLGLGPADWCSIFAHFLLTHKQHSCEKV